MKKLRIVLSGVGMQNAERLSWKSFRAGKASCMAAQGDDLGTILTFGEWRSRAFLNYVDKSTVDKSRLLQVSTDSSDEETGALPGLPIL